MQQTSEKLKIALTILFLLCVQGCSTVDPMPGEPIWQSWGGNLDNTHDANDTSINVDNVRNLRKKWVVRTGGSVSATPSLSTTRLYFPDWGSRYLGGSKLYTVDRESGDVVMSHSIYSYSNSFIYNVARSTPALSGDWLVFGDMRSAAASLFAIRTSHGASLYGINRSTGELKWKTQLDAHPLAVVTQSPVIHDGRIYVGVSSLEEAAARLDYKCCSFRGSMLALDLDTGKILWKTYMIPAPSDNKEPSFSGAAVWGSSPAIDTARRQLYIATGNNYTLPPDLVACSKAHKGDPQAQNQCYENMDRPDNYAESVLALDLNTGAVRWARKMHNYGAWTLACRPDIAPQLPVHEPNCQDLDGLDFDFGQAPMIVRAERSGLAKDVLGVGQKSGVFYALDPDNGSTLWATNVGPGGPLGGLEFGAATDGKRFYVQNTNFDHVPMTLTAGAHAGEVARGGIWAALDVKTGKVLWQTPDPSHNLPLKGDIDHTTWGSDLGPGFFAIAMGPLTISNGVLFAGSLDQEGHMYALNAATGDVLWSFASGGSVMSAPSITDGVLYWGSGYFTGFENDAVYAFELPKPE
ncbi:MAG TPA: PQQ-binding-like beta-propeller repeat protein [Dongiaceae bacterium]|nr:PQQ-binding-like beta-propeller repeat protein [Dongiaceae bacterium]